MLDQLGLTLLPHEPSALLFDLASTAPKLMKEARKAFPAIARVLPSIAKGFPLAPTCRTFNDETERCARPPMHYRAFYFSERPLQSKGRRGVLAFKGTEPCLADAASVLGAMTKLDGPNDVHAWAEHYALTETKVPIGTSRKEALRDALIALDVQQRYLRAYGQLAPLPLPLPLPLPIAVVQLPKPMVAAHAKRVAAVISLALWNKSSTSSPMALPPMLTPIRACRCASSTRCQRRARVVTRA